MQNPILSNRRTLNYYMGIWAIVTALHILMLVFSGEIAIAPAIVDALIANMLFCAIGLGLWFPIFFRDRTMKS